MIGFSIAFTSRAKFDPEKIFLKNINLENGLSQCVVTDMTIDKKGFLWIGTFDGLNRFDGNNFTTFKHVPNDPHSLPSSKIFKLFADDDDHLWIRTSNGLSIFDAQTGKVLRPDFLRKMVCTWVAKNDHHHIWLYAHQEGLILLNTKDFSYITYKHNNIILPSDCEEMDVYKIKSSVYIITTCGDIIRYDILKQQYEFLKNNLANRSTYDNSGLDKYGNIYLGSQQSDMVYFNTTNGTFGTSPLYLKHIKLISIKAVKYDPVNDILLLGTYGQGLFIYDYQRNHLAQFVKNGDGIKLSSNYIQSMAVDKNGIFYCGYDGAGFDVLDNFIKKFSTITRRDDDDLKSLRFVRKIAEDDNGNLLFGTSGSGLVKYHRGSHEFSFYNVNNVLTNSDNFIIEMLRVGNELWLGYNGSGIDIVDINSYKKLSTLKPGITEGTLTGGTIWSFLNDSIGHIWVGTREEGLNKINIATKKITRFDRTKFPQLSSALRCMALLRNQLILIGTEDGLFELDPKSEKLNKVFPFDSAYVGIKSFKSIYIDKKNRLWLCTDGMGLVVLSKDYKWLNNFNSTNSLNNDVVYGLLPEDDSTFWLSSNSGLSKLHWNESSLQRNGKVQVFNYDEKNGLQSNEFNTGAFTMLKDGSMAFGGLNGMNVFQPKEIKYNPILPSVYINAFKVFENPIQSDTIISFRSHINLKHFENSFSITFNTIGFTLQGKTKYKYRLVGYDKDWINADNRNYVSYTNMRSGKYEFQVKACNNDGVWNDQYTSLFIKIATPFYQTWWFILLLASSIGIIIYSIFNYRQRMAAERAALRIIHTKEIAEVEMKALRAQINPHFLFNSLNSINSYILKNDNKLASKYLVKFSQLVRNILNNSSNPYISLKEELSTIELYMHIEGMRFNNQFSYLIDVEPEINTANIRIPSLLLQPYVENAIWHGLLHKEGEKNIIIRVCKESEESVSIEIEDNGVGRLMAEAIEQKPKHRKSFGMQLGESRLKLMNNGHEVISSVKVIDKMNELNVAFGTIIRIIIPTHIFKEEQILLN